MSGIFVSYLVWITLDPYRYKLIHTFSKAAHYLICLMVGLLRKSHARTWNVQVLLTRYCFGPYLLLLQSISLLLRASWYVLVKAIGEFRVKTVCINWISLLMIGGSQAPELQYLPDKVKCYKKTWKKFLKLFGCFLARWITNCYHDVAVILIASMSSIFLGC